MDLDNDGRLDLFVANGEVRRIDALARAGDPYPLHQPNQLYRNRAGDDGGPRFEDVSDQAGPVMELSQVSRGVAFGDLDNDGDTDLVVTNNAGPVQLLLNQLGQDAHWIGFELFEHEGAAPAAQARVGVHRDGRLTLWRRVRSAAGNLSANDPRVLAGLGPDMAVREVEVRWADGGRERWTELAADRYHRLVRGQGQPAGEPGPNE